LFSCTVNAKCLIVFFEPGTVILVRYLNMNNRGVHKILKRVGFWKGWLKYKLSKIF